MIDLGVITNLQKQTSVSFKCEDTDGHQVTDWNGVALNASAPVVDFTNIIPNPNNEPGAYLADIVGIGIGTATITAKGQVANFGAFFSTLAFIEVVKDPSIPGPPALWVIEPGTVEAQ